MALTSETAPTPDNVIVPQGYSLQPFATGLTFPTALTFSDNHVWVSESGANPGTVPRVVQIGSNGEAITILSSEQLPEGAFAGPITDITFHDGEIWVTHRQVGANDWLVGAISKFDPANPVESFTTVITNLPSAGDHYAEEIAFDASGRAYFAQGSATNSSVVGPDNELVTQWLTQFPDFHDFPAQDVVLNGTEFHAPISVPGLNPENRVTAPFMPFGSGPIAPGTVVPAATPESPQEGMIAGNAAVYSFDPTAHDAASTLTLEGWGFRNPFGIGFDPFNPNLLFATNNGADIRSAPLDGLRVVESRPIANDFDDLFVIETGGTAEFFGWPDFFHDPNSGAVLPVTDPLFAQGALPINPPGFVLDEAFRNSLQVEPATAQFEYHSSANKFDFSASARFGSVGDLFVAETGSFTGVTGTPDLVGYKVVQVDRDTGNVTDFIAHTSNTVEEIFDPAGFNKPIDVKFQDGTMFIVDFGVFEPGLGLAQPATGKVWTVSATEPPKPPPDDHGSELLGKLFTFLVEEGLDLLRPYQLNPEGTGPAAPESPAVLEAAEQTDTFAALLAPANNSGVLGAALVQLDEEEGDATIAVAASGLTPNQVHPQHIHGFLDDRPSLIPNIALDQDLDGFVEGPEAGPVYGPVLLSATASGEISQEVVSTDFPAADAQGNLAFVQTYDFDLDDPEHASIFQELQDRLVGRLFQIHGVELAPGHGEGTEFEVNGSGGYIPALAAANGILLPIPHLELNDLLLA